VQNLLICLDSPELPFLQWQECLAVLANRLPKDLRTEVSSYHVALISIIMPINLSGFTLISDFVLV
jgi:acetyl-CoA carboxylase/biotin carboxylase 1